MFTHRAQETLRHQTSKGWNMLQTYKRGVVIGTGAITSVGGILYWFWPSIQNKITFTAQTVLSHENIQTTASSLTGNVLEDEQTYERVCKLVNRVLDTESVKLATTKLVTEVIQTPSVQNELKRLIISTYHDPEVLTETSIFASNVVQSEAVQIKVHNTVNAVLADENFREQVRASLKSAIFRY